ncbi:hypothetical protein YC2023_077920 [Brassica napus]|uniref:(rape) hypothetical protein n=1 Tax=Brassica napus TaxID=3708 RepID=A0A816QFV5_BRANA|nr:unnamed protein product [Brassica napus]
MTLHPTCPTSLTSLSTEKPCMNASTIRFSPTSPSFSQNTESAIFSFHQWEFTRIVRLHISTGSKTPTCRNKFFVSSGQGSFNPFFNPHTIYFFHHHVQVNNKTGKIHALPTLVHHNDYQRGVRPDFNINDNKAYEDFQTHAFRLNSAKQTFPIPFRPNWTYYPIDYQMSLNEDLQFFMEKQTQPPVVPKVSKIVKQEP